jgi:DNA mismatch repair protein MutL
LVRDRFLSSATRLAYGSALPQGTYPVLVVFVEAPPDEIDVNVHPAKTEVRFRNQELVHRLVRESIEQALLHVRPIPRFSVPRSEYSASEGIRYLHSTPKATSSVPQLSQLPAQEDGGIGVFDPLVRLAETPQNGDGTFIINNNIDYINEYLQSSTSCNTLHCGNLKVTDDALVIKREGITEVGDNLSFLRLIGRLSNTYILAADSQGLVIIDQHVAHERILFERYLRELQTRKVNSQRLLLPITFDLTPSQLMILEKIQNDLNLCGFEIESYGRNTISIKTVPASLSESDYRLLIAEIIEGFGEEIGYPNIERFFRILAANMACRAAVKANTQINDDKVSWILSELSKTSFPHACPHGRPILLRMTLREIEKRFLRI